MPNKRGRPIVGVEPKDQTIHLRATASMIRKFNECSKLTGRTKTDLMEDMLDALHVFLKQESTCQQKKQQKTVNSKKLA